MGSKQPQYPPGHPKKPGIREGFTPEEEKQTAEEWYDFEPIEKPLKPIPPDIVVIREGCDPIKVYSPLGHSCEYKDLCTKLSQLDLASFKSGDYTTAVDVLTYIKREIGDVMG